MISTSKINTYRHCPHKYFLQYIQKIKVDIKSEALEMGSRVHALISSRVFKSDIRIEQAMLTRAEAILGMYPPDPILETTYEDPKNPGRFYGDVCGERAVGIFDFHWVDLPFAGDWKTGNLNSVIPLASNWSPMTLRRASAPKGHGLVSLAASLM